MNIIIDTNVFMSGIFWSGPPAKILEAWQKNKINFVLSTDILEEYMRVSNILAKKYKGIEIEEIIDLLMKRSKIYHVSPLKEQISRDPADDMFIACELSSLTL